MTMKFNRIIAAIIGCLALLALPVSAETPILEELMRKYTFPLIFLSLAGAVVGIGYLYITGLLPKAIFETWRWIDERFELHRYVSLAKREYYSVVYTLMPATGRTMPQSILKDTMSKLYGTGIPFTHWEDCRSLLISY